MDALVFYIAGVITVVASWLVVTRRNPIYSAIFLVLVLTMNSVQFVVLRAPFIAVIQVLVYAGAVVVLFLFVLMLLNLTPEELRERVSRGRKVAAAVGSVALFILLAGVIFYSPTIQQAESLTAPLTNPVAGVAEAGETSFIAESLFRVHVLPFELTSLLIMIAVISAIYLTKSGKVRPVATPGAAESTGSKGSPAGDEEVSFDATILPGKPSGRGALDREEGA